MLDWNVSIPKEAVQIRGAKRRCYPHRQGRMAVQKNAAADAVRDLAGDIAFRTSLKSLPASARPTSKRIENVLERNAELETKAIHVDVSGGKVTLKASQDLV